jgi:RHS repeat-associated protein
MPRVQVTVGHPVDVATGVVYSTHEDISIRGKVDLVWERSYNSALVRSAPGSLGPGWTTRYFTSLTKDGTDFHFRTPEGGVEVFADPGGRIQQGEILRNFGSFQELSKVNDSYVVTRWDVDTGDITRYIFSAGRGGESWPLASVEDVTGQALDLSWSSGRLISVRQRLEGRALLIEYNALGRIVVVAFLLPDGHRQPVARYEYDPGGRLAAAYDALGYADRYEYDSESRLSREIVKDGGVFSFTYDRNGRCIKTSGLERFDEKTLRYQDAIHWTQVADSLGNITRYEWMQTGQVVREINAVGGVAQTNYDEHGRVVSGTSPNGAPFSYEYDQAGNRTKVSGPLGVKLEIAFNDRHLPVSLTDAKGGIWRREYDQQNRVVATVDPLGARWTVKYDARGNPVEITNPNGSMKSQVFSDKGVLLQATDWVGNPTEYQVDSFGRFVRSVGPLGERLEIQYDLLGRPSRIISPDNTSVTCVYDPGGNLVSITDGKGQSSAYRYASCGRLIEEVNPVGATVRYRWGTEPDRLEEIVNPKGETYTLRYDAAGRVVEEQGFDGRTTSVSYDPAGYQTAMTNAAGERITFERDLAGRLVRRILPDGTVAEFEYDGFDELVAASTPLSQVTFERDAIGRVLKETQDAYSVESRYDAVGNLIHTRTSLGHEASYEVDGNGLRTRVLSGAGSVTRFFRDPRGQDTRRILPGGVELSQAFDLDGRLVEQHVDSNTPAHHADAGLGRRSIHRRFEYDRAGALARLEDNLFGGVGYVYDEAERLLSSVRSVSQTEQFTYDLSNNIERIRVGGEPERHLTYGPGDRQLIARETRCEYDVNGRLIRKVESAGSSTVREWRYTWDALDQLRSVRTPEGQVWVYEYDALGRRVTKSSGSLRTSFVWDGDTVVHELLHDRMTSTWIFELDSFTPICTIQEGRVSSVIADHLGSPMELINEQGTVVWAARSDSWGHVGRIDVELARCPVRFQGQWYDEESGLHYNRFRYYDPLNGRYISPDPVRLAGGLNLYTYAYNAINLLDPFALNGGCPPKKGAKRGPKTDPNAPHNKKIREVASKITDGRVVAGGGVAPERLIPTPGGAKAGRRPDILVERPDGSLYAINVGRTTASGAPVPREVKAMNDLSNKGGIPTTFVPYDR